MTPGTTNPSGERRLLSVLALGLSSLCVVVLPIDALGGRWADLVVTLLFGALQLTIWWLNRRGRERVAFGLFLGGTNLLLFVSALVTHPDEHGSLPLVASAAVALALVPVGSPWLRWGTAGMAALFALVVEFPGPLLARLVAPPRPPDVALSLLNILASSAVLLGIITYRVRSHARSLSELRQVLHELQLQQALVVQASRSSALGEIAAGIAHEVNNPLSVVLIAADRSRQLLTRTPPDWVGARLQVARVATTARRVGRIVRSLLRLSAPDGAAPGLEPIAVDALVADTLDLCQERLQRAGVRIDVSVPFGLRVQGRETDLSQVLLNLLLNAFDAAKFQSVRWVRVEAVANPAEETVRIDVVDSGPGIPADVRARLMEPFFTTKKDGTGLGLTISRGLTERMGGSLSLVEDGPHTCFRLLLRRAAPSAGDEPREVERAG